MFNLQSFSLTDMIQCGAAVRNISNDCPTMEAAARKIVNYLYGNLRSEREASCALVRFYKTHRMSELPREERTVASALLKDHGASESIRCLTLLATAGERPEWNSRRLSRSHRAIPLPSEQIIEQFPMISQLIRQMGFDVRTLLEARNDIVLDIHEKNYNIFFVPEALGSPYIPAQQDFVIPYGIRCVLGFGGMLPSGDVFATILFSKTPIQPNTAEMFRTVALNVKMAILGYDGSSIFDPADTQNAASSS